jgi:hypothetical protein
MDSAKSTAAAKAVTEAMKPLHKTSIFAVGPVVAALLQLTYLAAAWTFCVAPGVAKNLPGMRCGKNNHRMPSFA